MRKRTLCSLGSKMQSPWHYTTLQLHFKVVDIAWYKETPFSNGIPRSKWWRWFKIIQLKLFFENSPFSNPWEVSTSRTKGMLTNYIIIDQEWFVLWLKVVGNKLHVMFNFILVGGWKFLWPSKTFYPLFGPLSMFITSNIQS